MKNKKQNKLLVIIALALSTLALTIGFAAFATTLTIESNANVKPNKEAFNIGIYGLFPEAGEDFNQKFTEFVNDGTDGSTLVEFFNTGKSYPYVIGNPTLSNTLSPAIIEENEISNLTYNFTKGNEAVVYAFLVRNDGEYKTYFNGNALTIDNLTPKHVLKQHLQIKLRKQLIL